MMINVLLSECNFNQPWISEKMKEIIDPCHKVCVIPFSFHDDWIRNASDFKKCYNKNDGRYYHALVDPFIDFGIDEENITFINYFTDDAKTACEKIEGSDVILLPGGLPDKLVERIEKFNIKREIENFDGVVIGFSAGAMAQLKQYHTTPDKDYPAFGYYHGLSLLKNFDIEVHFENTCIQNYYIKKVLSEKKKSLYTISNSGGLIVQDGKIETFGDVDLYKIK